MIPSLHISAAEDHELSARLHRAAAALSRQGQAVACSEMAARAGALATSAQSASNYAAARSLLDAQANRQGAPVRHVERPSPIKPTSRLQAPIESIGAIIKARTERRRSRSWIVI